ncbi:MAG: hypothetical protein Q4Q53_07910 [Methanocorpusculum sp.]|nr:hypothetical protein [Methanocorpusculum sp.]
MTSYVQFTADEIIDCLLDTLTAPEDFFELAMYYDSFVQASKEITEYFRNSYNQTIQFLRTENIKSDIYEVVEKFNENKVVDKAKLKAENPDVYYSAVHIKGSDAAKILGSAELYKAVVNKIGKERAARYEHVNVDDMDIYLHPVEGAAYLKEDGRSKGFFIEVKESADLV